MKLSFDSFLLILSEFTLQSVFLLLCRAVYRHVISGLVDVLIHLLIMSYLIAFHPLPAPIGHPHSAPLQKFIYQHPSTYSLALPAHILSQSWSVNLSYVFPCPILLPPISSPWPLICGAPTVASSSGWKQNAPY